MGSFFAAMQGTIAHYEFLGQQGTAILVLADKTGNIAS
jgi:hypothetical protein